MTQPNMIHPPFSHPRSLMNRVSGTLLLYFLFSVGVALILEIIWVMTFTISELGKGQDMTAISEQIANLASDPWLNIMLLFLSPPVAALAAVVGRSLTRVKFTPLFQPSRLNASTFALMVLVIIGVAYMASWISYPIDLLLSLFNLELTAPEVLSTLPTDPLMTVIFVIAICIGAPVCEELLCRGIILHALKPYGNSLAVIVSALFFALIHGNLVQGPMTFFLGLALGMITVRTQSLRPAIYIHMILNTSSVLKGYLLRPLEQGFSIILDIASQIGIMLFALVLVIINWGKIKTFLNIMNRRPGQSLQQEGMTETNKLEAISAVPVNISTVSADTSRENKNENDVAPQRPRRWFYFWTSWSTLIALILFIMNMILSIRAIPM